jgi:two-component system OmpR family sensor kinase
MRPRSVRRWRLRTQIVWTQVLLMAVVSTVIGVVSALSLDSFLVDRLDGQLRSSSDRALRELVSRPPVVPGTAAASVISPLPADVGDCSLGTVPPLPPGQSVGTLSAMICADGDGVADLDRALGLVSTRATPTGEPLTEDQLVPLTVLPRDGSITSVDLPELGTYRVLAVTGDQGNVLVTGLPLRDVRATVWRLTVVITVVTVLGLVAMAAAATVTVGWALRPLGRVAWTARRVSQLPLDHGEVALAERVPERDTDLRTEVGQVGSALNRMLEHVASALRSRQSSEMRVRRFVADASHELRTPLASIRGYAELTRRDRDGIDPRVAHALSRVESEAQRMTVLVEELLLLARLDEGRPLDSEAVDLTRLVLDVTGDARTIGPDHRWRMDLPERPVAVIGDSARLHQVLANLLSNARIHTPPGTTVTVALAVHEDDGVRWARVEVADDGPGIPAELLPEVFERFARADTSRSRSAGSTGLGLAIVHAVVQAHGGRVELDSSPGRTVFTVLIPAGPPLTGPEADEGPGPGEGRPTPSGRDE